MKGDSAGLEVLRPEEEKPERRRGLLLLLASLGVLALVLAVGGFYVARSLTAIENIDRDPGLNPLDYTNRPASPEAVGEAQHAPINFVLLGTDERNPDDTGRSDALLVAHLSGDRKNLYLVSFPRDLWVPIPEHGDGKINWAYAYGGAALSVRTLEELTGARIAHTVAIDFEGFMQLTTVLGGVTVHNPWPSGTNGYTYPEGEITLSGEAALSYVRERKSLPDGDLSRAYRQRTMVKAILQKAMTPGVLANPLAYSDFIGKITATMRVDEGLTTTTITELATSLRFSGSESIKLLQAPISGTGMVGDQAAVFVDESGLAELREALTGDEMAQYFEAHG